MNTIKTSKNYCIFQYLTITSTFEKLQKFYEDIFLKEGAVVTKDGEFNDEHV